MIFDVLREKADVYLIKGPFSVTDKTALEFSDNPHDYVSGRLYWWKEGDTYVRRDGEPNPENRGEKFDRQRLEDFINGTITLFLSYKQFNDAKYAERGATFIRTWFLDPETKMNPHLEFSQIVPTEKSRGVGIIDMYDFYYLLDVVEALVKEGFISKKENTRLQAWFRDYIDWLEHSEQGKKEKKRPNNHGTSHCLQVVRYLLFSGQKIKAFKYLWQAKKNHIARPQIRRSNRG